MAKTNVTPEYRDIVKIFNSLSGSKTLHQVFTDWVTMIACSISNTVEKHGQNLMRRWTGIYDKKRV